MVLGMGPPAGVGTTAEGEAQRAQDRNPRGRNGGA